MRGRETRQREPPTVGAVSKCPQEVGLALIRLAGSVVPALTAASQVCISRTLAWKRSSDSKPGAATGDAGVLANSFTRTSNPGPRLKAFLKD